MLTRQAMLLLVSRLELAWTGGLTTTTYLVQMELLLGYVMYMALSLNANFLP